MPLLPCGDRRESQARATRWATALSGVLPSPEHRIVGYTCKDCANPLLWRTPQALLTHCAIALRSGKHKSDTGPLPRRDPRYHVQHDGNLFAVANVPTPGTRDNPHTRILIPVNCQGQPHTDSRVPNEAQPVPGAESMELNSQQMPHDVPHHDGQSGPSRGNLDHDEPARNSFAQAVESRPTFSLLEVLTDGMDKILLARTQSDSIQAWGTMIARLSALKRFGLHRIPCTPRCRPEQRESTVPVTASEAAFLHATKHCSNEMKDELLHMIRHPHFDPAQIRWSSGSSMVAWSLTHVFTAEVNEEVLQHGKSHSS
jgi:hypothetical protein